MSYTPIKLTGIAGGQLLYWDTTSTALVNTATTEIVWDSVNKRIGIGIAAPAQKQEVLSATTYQQRLSYSNVIYTDIGTNSSGYLSIVPTGSLVNLTAGLTGTMPSPLVSVTPSANRGVFGFGFSYIDPEGTTLNGMTSDIKLFTSTAMMALRLRAERTGGTATWLYGTKIKAIVTGGTTTNVAAIYIDPVTGATNNYGIYQEGTENNYFRGKTGINTSSPDRNLEVLDTTNSQLRLTYTGSSVYTDFQTNSSGHLNISPTGGSVVFPQGTVTNPGIAFGDGDTGFYEVLDDLLAITTAGISRWQIQGNYFSATDANGPRLINDSASATVPNIVINKTDLNTGIGTAGSDELSLIAGGVEGARITTTTFDILKGIIKTDTVSPQDLTITTGAAKTLVLDTPVYEDLNFNPLSSGGPAATLPDYVTINNTIHREFTSANNQICGDSEETPHCYRLSSQIYPHVHIFLKSGESAGTTGVTFTLYWELRQSTGTTSGSVALSATSAELGTTAGANKLTISDSTGFAGAAELGSQLSLTLARTAGDAGDIVVTTYGVHYQIDTIGSRTISSK